MRKQIEMVGKKFGKLTVIELASNTGKKKYEKYWLCKCECGNFTIIGGSELRTGRTQSCGCLQRERTSKARKKNNTYDFIDDTILIYDDKGNYTVIDSIDFEKIKNLYWKKDCRGYWVAFDSNRGAGYSLNLHDLILFGEKYYLTISKGIMCDHKDGNRSNNRRNNLRSATRVENNRNLKIREDNTSGYSGVHYNKKGKWESYISFNKKKYTLGTYADKKEAILNRLIAQHILFKQHSRIDCKKEIDKIVFSPQDKSKALKNVISILKKGGIVMDNIKDYEDWLFGNDYKTHSEK